MEDCGGSGKFGGLSRDCDFQRRLYARFDLVIANAFCWFENYATKNDAEAWKDRTLKKAARVLDSLALELTRKFFFFQIKE